LGGFGLKDTKDQRPYAEVPLHFWCDVEKGHYELKSAWIQGFGREVTATQGLKPALISAVNAALKRRSST